MRAKDIKVDGWYKTRAGIGRVLSTTKFRGMIEVKIVYPLPIGQRVLKPAEVLEETVPPVEGAKGVPVEWT